MLKEHFQVGIMIVFLQLSKIKWMRIKDTLPTNIMKPSLPKPYKTSANKSPLSSSKRKPPGKVCRPISKNNATNLTGQDSYQARRESYWDSS
jgi:hypothetical protein